MVGPRSLVLILTRRCDLRCAYCPTVKDGWPDLDPEDAARAVSLFATRWGGGDVKLFGGEPLLCGDAVRAAFIEARRHPSIRRVQLSTNGVTLDEGWFRFLAGEDKALLCVSVDGAAADHRRLRRALPGVVDSHDRIRELLPSILSLPRVVATQVIAPSTAPRGAENFRAVLGMGFRKINLLPGYYVPWNEGQLAELRSAFQEIGDEIERCWDRGEALYLRNLGTLAPTPFFNTGLVVDCDRSIHPSNLGLSGRLERTRDDTALGDLDNPPTPEALLLRAAEVPAMLERALPPGIWRATLAVDQELSRLVRRLLPRWLRRVVRSQAA